MTSEEMQVMIDTQTQQIADLEHDRSDLTAERDSLRAELDASVVERPHRLDVRRSVLRELLLAVPSAEVPVLVERIRPLLLPRRDGENAIFQFSLHAILILAHLYRQSNST